MNDKLPVYDGHYLQDLGPEGGQVLMRLFIELSLKFAHREESKGLQSSELGGQISFDQQFFSGWPSAGLDDFSCVARKAFSTSSKNLVLCQHIFLLKMVCLHFIILEMGSFPMSVANNFCD
jgi:hypothetical protein